MNYNTHRVRYIEDGQNMTEKFPSIRDAMAFLGFLRVRKSYFGDNIELILDQPELIDA